MGELERTHELMVGEPDRWWNARDLTELLGFRPRAIYEVLRRLEAAGMVESRLSDAGRGHRLYKGVERC